MARGERPFWALGLALCLAGSLACDARPLRAVASAPGVKGGEVLRARVVGITDGDTVKVRVDQGELKVRLVGIDAPEQRQPYGKVSKQRLSDRAFARDVEVWVKGRDRYGRVLGKLVLEGRDLNLAQVEDGLAWHYADYARDQFPGDAERYAQAERRARQEAVGLWREAQPVPPWRWRRRNR